MNARLVLFALLGTLIATSAISLPQPTACSGVQREQLTSTEWATDLIRDDDGQALTVTLEAKSVSPGTVVEVLSGGVWSEVSVGAAVAGEAIRVSSGGSAHLGLRFGSCSDDWQTDHTD